MSDYAPLQTSPIPPGGSLSVAPGWAAGSDFTRAFPREDTVPDAPALADISAGGLLELGGDDVSALLRALYGAAPDTTGAVVTALSGDHAVIIARLTPAKAWLLCPAGTATAHLGQIRAAIAERAAFVTALDRSAGFATMLLVGNDSPALLSKLCALDFDAFADGEVRSSSLAKVRATLLRVDRHEKPAWLIVVDRSFGEYVWEMLLDAGLEFDLSAGG